MLGGESQYEEDSLAFKLVVNSRPFMFQSGSGGVEYPRIRQWGVKTSHVYPTQRHLNSLY